MKKKMTLVITALTLVVVMAIGGTLAYFTDTDEATNVFVVGNVDIELEEPSWKEPDHIVPGVTYDKDPYVLNVGVNDAWLRVDVILSDWAAFKAAAENHGITDLGTIFDGHDENKWTRAGIVENADDTVTYSYYYDSKLLAGSETPKLFTSVTIPAEFTNSEMAAIGNDFSIVVKAYAIQADGFDSAADAFANVTEFEASGVFATADNAQGKLDEVSAGTVVLADGSYDALALSADVGPYGSGTGTSEDPYVVTRELDNLTITGGADAKVAGFSIAQGYNVIYGDSTYYVDQSYDIGTLTFRGVTFTDKAFINCNYDVSIDALVFEDVTFAMSGEKDAAAHIISETGTLGSITFKNCTFTDCTDVAKAIAIDCRSDDDVSVTISGCTIDGAAHNGIQLGGAGGTYAGSIKVLNNSISNTTDRGIRVSTATGSVTISGNTLANAVDSANEAIKVDNETGCVLVIENNDLSGGAVVTK